tara:strand:- start:261 stop:662 length:402 start_codon:yes stop_codon:yes gene_type:complete
MHTHQEANNLKDNLINYSEDSPMREVCGFICKNDDGFEFERAINHSNIDENFLIKPIDYLHKKLKGNLIAIFHSHVSGSSEPSKHDKITSCNLLLPFLIYSLEDKNFSLFNLDGFEVEENCVKTLKEKLGIND